MNGEREREMSGMGSVSGGLAEAQKLHSVFVYGSLMADDVVRSLLHRIPLSSSALLHGFHRYSIKGRVYPAILPVKNKEVHGKVLMGITDPELYILDVFEDVEYERHSVEVSLPETEKNLLAHTYVWCNKDDPDLHGEWDFEGWKQVHLKDFVKMTVGFMEELDVPESKSTRVRTYETFYSQNGEDRPVN